MSPPQILVWKLLSVFLSPSSSKSLVYNIHSVSLSSAFHPPFPLLFTISNLDSPNKKIFIIFSLLRSGLQV